MAKMHSRAKGIAGSTKPTKKSVPAWLKYKPKEIELLITKYAKEGKTPSQIGIFMRDEYGIPDVQLITTKKITQILKEKNLLKEIPEDLTALIKKAVKVRRHMGENKHDYTALRGIQLTESKINRLVKHYKATKRLPKEWKYDPESIMLKV